MITGFLVYVNGETDLDGQKFLAAQIADVLVEFGLSNPEDREKDFVSVVVVKEFDPLNSDQFAEDILEDAVFAMIPVMPKLTEEEKNDDHVHDH